MNAQRAYDKRIDEMDQEARDLACAIRALKRRERRRRIGRLLKARKSNK